MKKTIKENYLFCILLLICGVYYGYRMFYLVPWYDELYTYLNFIEQGPVYSATHWPLPNNHVFFSVISSFLKPFGSIIALRGISWLSAMGTLILLYAFLKKAFSIKIGVFGASVYSILILSMQLAIQGRGYSLATFFLMLAIYSAFSIICGEKDDKHYKWFAVALWLGLYTLMSSVYWVFSVCVCAGLVLLCIGKIREMLKLVLSSVVAAVLTLVSYAILWVSVGAQQIAADPTSGYFGKDILYLALEFPRTALTRGFQYMQSDQNLQGIGDAEVFLHDFKYFARSILKSFTDYPEMSIWYVFLLGILVAFVIFVLVLIFKKKIVFNKRESYLYVMALSSIGFLVTFGILYVQCVYPFNRVFSYCGVFLAIMVSGFVTFIVSFLHKIPGYAKVKPFMIVFNLLLMAFVVKCFTSPSYNKEYEKLDYYAYDAVQNVDMDGYFTYMTGDPYINQQFEYEYIINEDLILKMDRENPDILFIRRERAGDAWSNSLTMEEMEKLDVESRKLIYENEIYMVYEKVKIELDSQEEVPKASEIPEVMFNH